MSKNDKNDNLEEVLSFMCECAKEKYVNEQQRENAIIQQAGTMQAAFSFVTAAVLMVAPIAVQYRGKMTYSFLLLAFSSIIATLIVCLFWATKALDRRKNDAMTDVITMNDYITNNIDLFQSANQRLKYLSETYGVIQKSIVDTNEKRIKCLRYSQITFYIALCECVCWFVLALFIMI